MSAASESIEQAVLVSGATGGVGQLVVARLLSHGYNKIRVLTRSASKAENMFNNKVEVVVGDIRDPATLPAAVTGVSYIICCVGTTAFPSARWEFSPQPNLFEWIKLFSDREYAIAKANNSPSKVDAQGVSNLVAVAPSHLKRFVFVSTCGVERSDQFPFKILNAFGVLDAKQKAEQAIINSGLPYTIIRPGRLIDGPYTSYDLNTLLKAHTGGKLGVVLGTGDTLVGQTSRTDVAAACVESLENSDCEGKVFEMINQGPRPSEIDWSKLFSSL